MNDIEDIKQDAKIANILKKLKDAKIEVHEDDSQVKPDVVSNDSSLEIPASDFTVQRSSQVVNTVSQNNVVLNSYQFDGDEGILPWFNLNDRDLSMFHYAKFDDLGKLLYSSISSNKIKEIASIKLEKDFACDIDYFSSDHYVLFIKQLDSNYSSIRSFKACSKDCDIVVEDTKFISDSVEVTEPVNNEFEKSFDIIDLVAESNKYSQYVVFTDKGIAEFVAKSYDVVYPYEFSEFNKWFEETSNFIQLNNAKFDSNSLLINNSLMDIRDFKYDIITMHKPGVITLDSIDNQDQNYQVNIKLKDEFSFIPLSRVIGCLKHYASDNHKSIDDFRRFIDRYFIVL